MYVLLNTALTLGFRLAEKGESFSCLVTWGAR
jgi:hypothetical protein